MLEILPAIVYVVSKSSDLATDDVHLLVYTLCFQYGSSSPPRAATLLTDWALKRWGDRSLRADNTTALVIYLQNPDTPPVAPLIQSSFLTPAQPTQVAPLHRVQSTQLRESPHLLKFQRKPMLGARHSPRASPTKPSPPVSPRKVFSFTNMFSSPPEPPKQPRWRRHSYHGPARRPRAGRTAQRKHKCVSNEPA